MFDQQKYETDARQYIDLMERLTHLALDGTDRLAAQSFALSRASGEAYANYAKSMSEVMQRAMSSLQPAKT